MKVNPAFQSNHKVEIGEENLGYTQGILDDGTYYEAELWVWDGCTNVSIILPEKQEYVPDNSFLARKTEEKIVDAGELTCAAEASDRSVLIQGMAIREESLCYEETSRYVDYLENMGLIEFPSQLRNGSASAYTDVLGNSVVQIIVTLDDPEYGVMANSRMHFAPFAGVHAEGEPVFKVIKGGKEPESIETDAKWDVPTLVKHANRILEEAQGIPDMTEEELMEYDAEYGYFQEEEDNIVGDGKYPVVTLCGSTRFKEEFFTMQRELTACGHIVLMPGVFGNTGDKVTEPQKKMLDDMHKQKIDMSDWIYVVNPDGYIGASTWSEIVYALIAGKGVRFAKYSNHAEWVTRRHLLEAEQLAFKQLDGLLHAQCVDLNEAIWFTVDDAARPGEEAYIFDPWIDLEANNGNVAFPDHNNSECAVNPLVAYPRQKVARFIENIIREKMPEFCTAEALFYNAYDHTTNHADEVKRSKFCSCLSCGSTFTPDNITRWVDDDQTPVCPRCSVDMVFGHDIGIPTDKEAIAAMSDYESACCKVDWDLKIGTFEYRDDLLFLAVDSVPMSEQSECKESVL